MKKYQHYIDERDIQVYVYQIQDIKSWSMSQSKLKENADEKLLYRVRHSQLSLL